MNFVFKLAALLLLGCLLSVSLAGQVVPQAMLSNPATGGCHHGGEMPTPQPSNFRCCQAGHNTALVQPVPHEELVVFGVVRERSSAFNLGTSTLTAGSRQATLLTYQPPGGVPLRI